jgi:hypothetical protein
VADEGLVSGMLTPVPVILTRDEASTISLALGMFLKSAEETAREHRNPNLANALLEPVRTALPKLEAASQGFGAEFLTQCREMHGILLQLIPSTAFRKEVKDWLPFGLEERCKNWVRDERVLEWIRNLARGSG